MRRSDLAPPSRAYFEAMRRLRLEPPDEETVERIVEIARRIWRKQDEEKSADQEGSGGGAPRSWYLRGLAGRFRTYLARRRSSVSASSSDEMRPSYRD